VYGEHNPLITPGEDDVMPKINVYLPDDLADAVKEANIPVSAVCQRALELAVRRVTAMREAASQVGHADDDPLGDNQARFTDRARTVVRLAFDRAKLENAPGVGTEHLLAGILAEGDNLAVRVLGALEITPDRIERELARQQSTETGQARGFTAAAAQAMSSSVAESLTIGHNYVGTEHVLLGLIAEPDGVAGHVLRALGAEPRLARRAVAAALAGYVHLQAQGAGNTPTRAGAELVAESVRTELRPIIDRLARVEQHLGLTGAQ
jgi:post-segregation antitoxin (ccd killing protein)